MCTFRDNTRTHTTQLMHCVRKNKPLIRYMFITDVWHFYVSANVVAGGIMFSEYACVSPEQTLLETRKISWVFVRGIWPNFHHINWLLGKNKSIKFWVKMSKVKVTVELNMPQKAIFVLISTIFRLLVVTRWTRDNSRQSGNHHLV